MPHTYHLPPKLIPARSTGPGRELFVVEGDSAGNAVAAARDPELQGVLPFQGKPMNPLRHAPERVLAHAAFRTLVEVLGCGAGEGCNPAACRYERVLLLFDPDADGVHAAALTLLFFARFQRPLVAAGRVLQVRAPVATLEHDRLAGPIDALSPADLDRALVSLREHGIDDPRRRTYRGLASCDPPVIARACLEPATRVARPVTLAEAKRVAAMLGL